MTGEYDLEAIESMQAGWAADQAERDRLRAINADLLAALREGVLLEDGDLTGVKWRVAVHEWLRKSRAAIAAAEAASEGKADD